MNASSFPNDFMKGRHWVKGVGRGWGQAVFNQRFEIPLNPVKIRLKSGKNRLKSGQNQNPSKSCAFRGTRRTPTGLKK